MSAAPNGMLTLIFASDHNSQSVTVGPLPQFSVVGGALSAGGPVLAWHTDGAWRLGDHAFTRIECEGRVLVEFRRESGERAALGPYENVSLAGSTVMAREGILARYREFEEAWVLQSEGAECSAILVKAA